MACAPESAARRRRRRACSDATASTREILRWSGHKPRSRPAGGGARRRATGCCARPAAGAASCTCWSRITPMTRPRPWPCGLPAQSGPDGLAGMAAAGRAVATCACCGRCSGVPGPGSPRRCSRAACRGSTIPRTSIRASNGRGCRANGALRLRAPAAAAPNGRSATAHWPQAAVEILEFDQEGDVADRPGWHLPAWARSAGEAAQPGDPGRGRRRPSAAAGAAGAGGRPALRAVRWQPERGKSGRGQDFTLSGCRLMLRKAPESRRLRWIVRPEHGRRAKWASP